MSNETELRDFVKQQASATRRGGNILLVVGIVLIVVIVGYFSYVLGRLKRELQAQDVVDIVCAKVEKAVADYMPQAETFIMEQAPTIMDEAKDQIVKNLPKLREQAEKQLEGLADSATAKIEARISDEVQGIMNTHGPEIRQALEAAGDVQASETAKLDLTNALIVEFEKVAVEEVDPFLPEILEAFEKLEGDLTVLVEKPSEQLDEVQKIEREMLQIVYTLCSRAYAQVKTGG